jgi:hypothetical protein
MEALPVAWAVASEEYATAPAEEDPFSIEQAAERLVRHRSARNSVD